MTDPPERPACPGPNGAPIDWAAALAQHRRWLRVVVLTRLKEAQAVDEVMQEVALAVVRQRPMLHDAEKLPAWLYRLAVRQALLYRRRRGRQRKLLGRYREKVPSAADEVAPAGDPLAWLLADERRQLVRQALDGLPRRDAEILLLKYTQNWSYRELARHLGISHSAIEARLHRARARLRRDLVAKDVVEV